MTKKKVSQKKPLQYTLPFILVVIIAALGLSYWNISQVKTVTSFEECVAARFPIKQSYPVQCTTPQGKIFIQKIAPVPTPEEVSIIGELTCLPPRNPDVIHTMECAFGLKDDKGNYYALKDSDPTYKNVSQPTGKSYEAKGIFTPDEDAQYQSIGIITLTSLTPR